MKLCSIIIYTLCICVSLMSYSCTSYPANEHGDKVVKLSVPITPRKLKVNEEAMVKDFGKKDDLAFQPSFNKLDVASPDNNIETNEIHANKGKQEELDEAKEAEYFTMDYMPRKNRPPVHNKSQPSSKASSP